MPVVNTRSSLNPLRDVFVFFYAIGLAFSAIAAYLGADTWLFVNKSSHADGTVVALKKGMKLQTWPIVAFETANGVRIKFQGNKPSQLSPRFPIGTQLDVLYDKHEPSIARINTIVDVWGLVFCFGILGIGFLALGTVVRFKTPRQSYPAPGTPRE